MSASVGDRIIIESRQVGQSARTGVILELIEASYGTRYRVQWQDGHESTIRPAAGSATFVHPRKIKASKAPTRHGASITQRDI